MATLATTTDVLSKVRQALAQDASAAAGNTVVSRPEQKNLPDLLMQTAADELRLAYGPGARVYVDALVTQAETKIANLLRLVNFTGPGVVAKKEVQQLAQLDQDAGRRVAKAYELITGRAIDLSGVAPIANPPAAPPGVPLLLANLHYTSPSEMSFAAELMSATAMTVKGVMSAPATFSLEVGGVPVTLTYPEFHGSIGGAGNSVSQRDVIEDLRAHFDVAVSNWEKGMANVHLYPRGTAPAHEGGPIYAAGTWVGTHSGGPILEASGPLGIKTTIADLNSGSTLRFRVDDKIFEATAQAGDTMLQVLRNLRDQLQAAGYTAEVRGPSYGFVSLRVIP